MRFVNRNFQKIHRHFDVFKAKTYQKPYNLHKFPFLRFPIQKYLQIEAVFGLKDFSISTSKLTSNFLQQKLHFNSIINKCTKFHYSNIIMMTPVKSTIIFFHCSSFQKVIHFSVLSFNSRLFVVKFCKILLIVFVILSVFFEFGD